MKFYHLLFAVLLFIASSSCSSYESNSNTITGDWEAFYFTSNGQHVPGYLVEDFTLSFSNDGKYKGNLNWIQLENEGTYLIQENNLILDKDTFLVKKSANDTLILNYNSFGVPFVIKLCSKK